MKNLFFSLAFMLIGTFAFANTQSVDKQKNGTIENCINKLKISLDLGNLSNLSETEFNKLLDNLPLQVINSEQFSECTIEYSVTFTFMGVSTTVSSSGTAATCAEAGNIARSGIRNEISKAKALIADMF
ncbi:hypothetical protein [Flavobacterium sp.]|uniref:hypothetical protein n=1 Tax=Flavobacterium sp. TaxID=239 RepID=UPI003750FCE0